MTARREKHAPQSQQEHGVQRDPARRIAEISHDAGPPGGGDLAEASPQGAVSGRPCLRLPHGRAVARQDSPHGPLLRLGELRQRGGRPCHLLGDDALKIQHGGALSHERRLGRLDGGKRLVDLNEDGRGRAG